MAQKAAKQQAARNTAVLNRAHLISLIINLLFIFSRFLVFRSSCSRSTYVLYGLVTGPALVIEFWLEKIGRPSLTPNGELKKSGDDLEAKGLTEYMFDIMYWSWITILAAAVLGDVGWWLWTIIPLYSAWLAYTTFGSMRQGMANMMGQNSGEGGGPTSNRQKKLEKRGGQKVQYR